MRSKFVRLVAFAALAVAAAGAVAELRSERDPGAEAARSAVSAKG